MLQHALERHAAAVRQLSNTTNGDDLYMRITAVWDTIQTVNSPMYDTYMSTPGNTMKLRAMHSNIQAAQNNPSLVGSEPTSQHTLSQLINPLCQPDIKYTE